MINTIAKLGNNKFSRKSIGRFLSTLGIGTNALIRFSSYYLLRLSSNGDPLINKCVTSTTSASLTYILEKRDSGFKCKWDGGQIPASILAASKGLVVGVREKSTLLESSSINNMRSSLFNSHVSGSNNEGGDSNPSSLNISSINTEVAKSETKTTKSTEEPSNNSFSEIPSINANSSKGEMVLMTCVKFKIDILPSDESNPEKKNLPSNIYTTTNNIRHFKVAFRQFFGIKKCCNSPN
ncbi:hypothetical protein H8356DRAFT_1288350 [Neocallimastix lanati (nom. inval.)]|nr:hypothetical protein H8356DRAFT_1288350 [Neocallimastix sp. JGI-2020a]